MGLSGVVDDDSLDWFVLLTVNTLDSVSQHLVAVVGGKDDRNHRVTHQRHFVVRCFESYFLRPHTKTNISATLKILTVDYYYV